MITKPCAKINLGLYVTERRADGYHNLETVFYPIPLRDELEVETSDKDELLVEGIPIAGNAEDRSAGKDALLKENLVMRVVRKLRDEGHDIPPLRIKLRKNIPSGAGLGGGSSDAAYMMRMLNEMFHLGLSIEEMECSVSHLGADCAFFIQHKPVMAKGIGDLFTPINLDLTGWHILLVKPDDFISTREAYQGVEPRLPQHNLEDSIQRPVDEWKTLVENDFERSVFPQHHTVAGIKQRLYEAGAQYAAMSGSGSSVFGLFREKPSSALADAFAPHFIFLGTL